VSGCTNTSPGVGVGHDQLVDDHAVDPLELLVVVVVVEPHPALGAELADPVEQLRPAQHVVAIGPRVELDVAPDLPVAERGLVVQCRRQDVLPQRVEVAADDPQTEAAQHLVELVGVEAEADPRVGRRPVVGRLERPEAELGQPPQRPPGIGRQRLAHRVQLQAAVNHHGPSLTGAGAAHH
jgi:hypothetical protein